MSGAVFFLVLVQAADPAADLLKREWAAVEEMARRPDLKSALQGLARSKDADLAWWAGAALAELEAREQAGKAWREPLRVTFTAKERGASEVFREILGFARPSPPPVDVIEEDRPVTVAFKETPYFQALDEVSLQAGVVLARGAGGRRQMVRADPSHGPRQYRSSFAVSTVQLARKTDVTFREDPDSQLHLQLLLRVDPTVRMVDTEGECVIVLARDDTGHSLLKEGSTPGVRIRSGEGEAALQLVLGLPPPEARRISLLRGTVSITLARKTEEIEFGNLGKAPEQVRESGGVKAVLKSIERSGDEIRVEIELSAKERLPWPDADNILLDDGEGRPFQRAGSSMSSSASGATYRLTFRDRDGVGEARRLQVSVVSETYPRKVFFELRDFVMR